MKLLDILLEKEKSNNATISKPMGNVVFADSDNDPALAKLQGFKPKSEPNTPFESELYSALEDWTADPSFSMKFLNKAKEKLFYLVKKYPLILKPNVPTGTVMYRGVGDISKTTISQLRESKLSDWTQLKEDYWLYKKPLDYRPRSPIQSWTYNFGTGQDFAGEGMLVTNMNYNEFLINSKVLRIMFGSDEKEILHFGKEYANKVYIALDEGIFEDKIRGYITPGGKDKRVSLKKFDPKKFKSK